MKTIFALLLCCSVALLSCSKSEVKTFNKAALPGTWKLVEMLADPGDGSGTWQPATAPLELTFTTTNSIEGNAFPQARRYEILNDSTIRFVYSDETFIIYNYTLTESTLSLSGGGCIEACGLKFRKTAQYSGF